MTETATWRQLREELERIAPAPKSTCESPPGLTRDFAEQVAGAKWMKEEEMWNRLRADIEAARLRIRAVLDAYRSRKQLAGDGSYSRDDKSTSKARDSNGLLRAD